MRREVTYHERPHRHNEQRIAYQIHVGFYGTDWQDSFVTLSQFSKTMQDILVPEYHRIVKERPTPHEMWEYGASDKLVLVFPFASRADAMLFKLSLPG